MQLPTTFRDPASTVGAPGPTNTSTHNPGWTNIDNSGKYWLAGGGMVYMDQIRHTSGVGEQVLLVGGSPFAGASNEVDILLMEQQHYKILDLVSGMGRAPVSCPPT